MSDEELQAQLWLTWSPDPSKPHDKPWRRWGEGFVCWRIGNDGNGQFLILERGLGCGLEYVFRSMRVPCLCDMVFFLRASTRIK